MEKVLKFGEKFTSLQKLDDFKALIKNFLVILNILSPISKAVPCQDNQTCNHMTRNMQFYCLCINQCFSAFCIRSGFMFFSKYCLAGWAGVRSVTLT